MVKNIDMRHLKLYENFKSDDFYKEIDQSLYSQRTSKDNRGERGEFSNLEKITEEEFEFLKKSIINPNYISSIFRDTCVEFGFGSLEFSDRVYFLNKVVDSWWYVCEQTYDSIVHSFKYYQCDRWDGLIKLLSDKKLISNEVLKEI